MPPPRSRRPPTARGPRAARRRPPRRRARRCAPSRRPRSGRSRTPSSVREGAERMAFEAFARHDEQEPADRRPPRQRARARRGPSPARAVRRRARPRPRRHPEGAAQLRPAAGEPIGLLAEPLDVDGVREDAHALGMRAARDHRVARERARDEQPGRALDDRRHDRALDGSPPSGARPLVVALDDEQVRHVLQIRTTRSPPARRTCSSPRRPRRRAERPVKRADDAGRHRVVVVEDALRARDAESAQEDGVGASARRATSAPRRCRLRRSP